MTKYSVIGIVHGLVEQYDLSDEIDALCKAKELVDRDAKIVEIFDENDEIAWSSIEVRSTERFMVRR